MTAPTSSDPSRSSDESGDLSLQRPTRADGPKKPPVSLFNNNNNIINKGTNGLDVSASRESVSSSEMAPPFVANPQILTYSPVRRPKHQRQLPTRRPDSSVSRFSRYRLCRLFHIIYPPGGSKAPMGLGRRTQKSLQVSPLRAKMVAYCSSVRD
jgi:hypothetical protein